MSILKVATWNVNSLRVRLPQVLTWLNDVKPDILALQEIKVPDEDFPLSEITEKGYKAVFSGQKTYNGVALISKRPAIDVVTRLPDLLDTQRRILGATIDDMRVFNLYVPNGEHVGSTKYVYKLNWLDNLIALLKKELQKSNKIILLGDFNIAPDPMDVYDPKAWEGRVLFSGPERRAFHDLLAVGFEDCFRKARPSEKQYSWWDYRLNAFKRNMGLRIDHVLMSKALVTGMSQCYIDTLPRAWERPSDHAPVVAEFKITTQSMEQLASRI